MTRQKSLYELDFHAWCYNQAALLAKGKFEELDVNHIAEELERMGEKEKRELENRFCQLFLHLLKWKYQPEKRSNSWKNSMNIQRLEIEEQLLDYPSLKSSFHECRKKGYRNGRKEASKETSIDIEKFPEKNPFSYPEFLEKGWLPE